MTIYTTLHRNLAIPADYHRANVEARALHPAQRALAIDGLREAGELSGGAVERQPEYALKYSAWLAKETARQVAIEQAAENVRAALAAWDEEMSARIHDENTADLLACLAELNNTEHGDIATRLLRKDSET